MSELQIQKYQDILRRSVETLETNDPAEREAGYKKLRLALEVLLAKSQTSVGPEIASALHDALENMIEEHRSGTDKADSSEQPEVDGQVAAAPLVVAQHARSHSAPYAFLAGALLGLMVAAATAVGLAAAGIVSGSANVTAGTSAVALAYQANLPLIEVAEEFLERVRQEVVGRQASDPEGLGKITGEKFVALKNLAPELAAQLPKVLPSTAVIVRADAMGYKILFNWPLCATVQFAKPELLDPVRKPGTLGCSYFGIWNEAGAAW